MDKIAAGINSDKFKAVAGSVAHDLHEIVTAGEAVAGVFAKVPAPVIETAIHLGELAVAAKLIGSVAEGVTGGIARLGAAIAGDTAATAAETRVVTANSAAWEANAKTRGGAAAASVAVTEIETAGAAAKIGNTVAGLGKTLGRIAVPVAISLVAYEIVGKPVEDAIRQKVSELTRPQANIGTLNTDDEASFKAGIAKRIAEQQKIVDEFNREYGPEGHHNAKYTIAKIENLGGELQSERDYKNALANIETLKKAEADYQQVHSNTAELGPALPPGYQDIVDQNQKATKS
jgi:hypothetical protein